MLFIDDLAVIGILQRVLAVLLFDLCADLSDQCVLHVAVAEDVIGRNAGLPAVEIFTEDDALCRQPELCRAVHDAGTLAAELQNSGR